MTRVSKPRAHQSDTQRKQRLTGYRTTKHDSSIFSYSASTSVTKTSHRGAQVSRRLAAYVYIEKQWDEQSYLPSPPSSNSPQTADYVTRATAFQKSSQESPLQLLHERLVPRAQPTHSWTFNERQALCLFKRIYEIGWMELANLMNSIFPTRGPPFSRPMLQSQYSDLKGWHCPTPHALAAYASVWKWAFNELDAAFAYRIARAKVQATSLGIKLQKRSSDDTVELRAAKNNRLARPSVFRMDTPDKGYESDRETTPMSLVGDDPTVKTEKEESQRETRVAPHSPISTPIKPSLFSSTQTGTRPKSKSACAVLSSQPNVCLAIKRFQTPSYPILASHTNETLQFESVSLPALLFRSVGSGTAGASSARFIYSGRHAPFAGRPVHVPHDPEVMLDDCELHIGRHEVHSSLISTTQSLIWALMKTNHLPGDSSSKYLYVIDASAANSRTKVFAGHVLAKELRNRGRLQPSDIRKAGDNCQTLSLCRYTGYYDYLVYGEVSGPAIIKRVSLTELEVLCQSCTHVARFLRLNLFENVVSIRPLFSKLKNEPVELDSSAGTAMAKITLFFGVGPNAASDVITHFISTLLQNWQIMASSPAKSQQAVRAFVEHFAEDVVVEEDWVRLEQSAREAVTRWTRESCKARSKG